MTTWAQFRADLLSAVKAVVPGHQVVWRDNPRPSKKPNTAIVIMNMRTFFMGQGGPDEVRYEDNAGDFTEHDIAWRRCTVSFQVETNQQTDTGIALNTADDILMKLASFNDQSALITVLNCNSMESFDENDRAISVIAFDMVWGVLIDRTISGQDYFDHIELTSHVQVVAGTDLPQPPNYTALLIPDANILTDGGNTLTDGGNVLVLQ